MLESCSSFGNIGALKNWTVAKSVGKYDMFDMCDRTTVDNIQENLFQILLMK